MKLKDFIKSLKDYEWKIKNGAIRSDTGDKRINCCPLTVKTEETEDMYGECADKLGIPASVYIPITEAADHTIEELKIRNPVMMRTDNSNVIELRKILFRELELREELL